MNERQRAHVEYFLERIEHWRGLKRVLLEDGEALRKYFTYVAAVEVDDSNDSRICEVFEAGGERAEEDILETLLARLSDEDERFYRELDAEDLLFENVEALSRSFKGRMTVAVMEEVSTIAEGRLEKRESDNLT